MDSWMSLSMRMPPSTGPADTAAAEHAASRTAAREKGLLNGLAGGGSARLGRLSM